MIGQLFGYEAALSLDALALPLREAREVIERAIAAQTDGEGVLRHVRAEIGIASDRFADGLGAGSYDGHLEASTAVRLAMVLRDATSDAPLEAYQRDSGKIT